uniref:Uncharacterized protein n=1 Tax=Glossina pallidipes TaxID=7398 RepID=A0A1A9ZIT5_GLOPL
MRVPRIGLAAAAVGRIVALRESHFSVNTPPIPRTIAIGDTLSGNKATNQLIDCRPMAYNIEPVYRTFAHKGEANVNMKSNKFFLKNKDFFITSKERKEVYLRNLFSAGDHKVFSAAWCPMTTGNMGMD